MGGIARDHDEGEMVLVVMLRIDADACDASVVDNRVDIS